MSQNKIILDLCGGTGSWSEPYRKAGYDVHLITLPDFDIRETLYFQGDDRDGSWNDNLGVHFFPTGGPDGPRGDDGIMLNFSDIHGILAAPPCTQFSLARQTAKTPRDFQGAMELVRFCLDIIYACRIHGNLKFWALENPTGYLRQFLGKPPMRFMQWEYGGRFDKPTDLWGYFNTPRKLIRERPIWAQAGGAQRAEWANPKIPKEIMERVSKWGDRRAAVRAITPKGFAEAFFRANP